MFRQRNLKTTDSVQAALDELPTGTKRSYYASVLSRFEASKEIAQIMNSRLSATKYRLSQGLKTLSKLLSKEDWL